MMKHILLATVKDRIGLMPTILGSIKRHLPGWNVVIVAQEYTDADTASVVKMLPTASVLGLRQRVGPHRAKVAGLNGIASAERLQKSESFTVCSIDDDMEFTAKTNLTPAVEYCSRPGVGLVSAGWVKHENQLAEKQCVDEFIEQKIVYTGGGLLFSKAVAELILSIRPDDYFCDNSEWALATYRAGYNNYRYRGSVSIHRICGKGGRRAWVGQATRPIPDARYLKMKPAKQSGLNAWHVGSSDDLTPLAHEEHARNRERLLGVVNEAAS